jgi:RNA polymerase sigma factor (sigma-70 family)
MTECASSGISDHDLTVLMIAAQRGDQVAYRQLLYSCQPLICEVARKGGIVGDRIDDVVQETLLSVDRARQTFDPSRSFIAWLTLLAKRRTVDILNRSEQRDRHEVGGLE